MGLKDGNPGTVVSFSLLSEILTGSQFGPSGGGGWSQDSLSLLWQSPRASGGVAAVSINIREGCP